LSKGLKIFVWTVAVLIVMLLLLFAAVKIFFPAEKVRALIIQNIEKTLNRKVTVDDASISIWGGLGLKLHNLTVSNHPAFSEEPLFTLDNLDVKMKIIPLISGKYEFGKISLNTFTLFLEKSESGAFNFDDLGSPDEKEITAAEGATSIPFIFEKLEVKSSRLVFIDDSSGYNIFLEGISLDSKMEKNGFDGVFYSEGMLNISALKFEDKKQLINLPNLAFSAELKTRLNQKSETLEIEKIDIGLAELSGQLDGQISSIYSAPVCDLNFITKKFSILQMASILPLDVIKDFADWETDGDIFASASLTGELLTPKNLDFTGKVSFENIKLGHPSINGDLIAETGEINIKQKAVNFLFESCTFAGEPVSLKLYMKDIFTPQLTADIELSANLRSFRDYFKDINELSGRIYADINLNYDLNEPETTQIDGGLVLEDIRLVHSNLAYPIEEIDLECEFRRRDILIESLNAEIGSSTFKLDGTMIDIIPYLSAPEKVSIPPVIRFTLSSSYMNFDEIITMIPVDSQTAIITDSTTELTQALPKLSATGTIDISSGVYSQVEFEQFIGNLEFRDKVLHIDKIETELYGGLLDGEVIVDYENANAPEFQIDFSARDIEINKFMSRMTALDDMIFGRTQMSSSFAGVIGEPTDVIDQLTAKGMVLINEGRITNLPLLKTIADNLQLQTFDEEKFRDFRNSFKIQDGKVIFDSHSMKIANADWELSGIVGFDGELDYNIIITADRKTLLGTGVFDDLGDLFGKKGGKVTIPVRLTGNYQEPKIALDRSKLTESADKRLKEEGQKLLNNLLNND
jgi:AsmA family/AsmA-like C-terminal region